MDNKFIVIYYESAEGKCPVMEFIDSRNKRNQAKILSQISFLEDGIHELRIKLSGDQIRILYFFCYKNIIVLTHAFPKSTDKIPKPEIKKTQKYREDFMQRFTGTQLREIQNENL